MSCNYAEGLSDYEHKGVLGLPEKFESDEKVSEKCNILVQWIKDSKHVVVHTGAGISTSAGIPDFRGPNGVWTLEKQGKKPNMNISFNDAIPTKTHMALKHLLENNFVHFIVSQNIDGLHLKSGIPRNKIAELHGNMFIAQCNTCNSLFIRQDATSTVGKKCLDEDCKRSTLNRRSCRGKLHDTILDWEDGLPEMDLDLAEYHSSLADLNICLGTTLQIKPSGNLPLRCKKYGGRLVIINLQPTKYDKRADLVINTYVDDIMEKILKKIGMELPEYELGQDPTKAMDSNCFVKEWIVPKSEIDRMKSLYEGLCRNDKKRKSNNEKPDAKKNLKGEPFLTDEKEDKSVLTKLCD